MRMFGAIGADESLFVRFPPNSIDRFGRLVPATIRLPRTSCLRSRYSDPVDALSLGCCGNVDKSTYGVMSVAMRALNAPLKALAENQPGPAAPGHPPQYRNLLIEAIHVPIRNCFAHSELDRFAILPSRLAIDQDHMTDEEITGIQFAIAGSANVVVPSADKRVASN
jgi:hypothetical protein